MSKCKDAHEIVDSWYLFRTIKACFTKERIEFHPHFHEDKSKIKGIKRIIYLSAIDKIDLLKKLFGEVFIPNAVKQEMI